MTADGTFKKLLSIAITSYLTISTNLLTYLGVPYVSDGGLFIFKIHPASYLLYAAIGIRIFKESCFREHVIPFIFRIRSIRSYFAAMLACFVYTYLVTGRGNSVVLLDTFLPAGIVIGFTAELKVDYRLSLRRTLQFGIFVNAILAIFEAILRLNLVPIYLDATAYTPIDEEFRPTALFDHPLTGGIVSMIGLALVPSRGWSGLVYTFVLVASLIAFGGRVAAAMSVLSILVFRVILLARTVLRRDIRSVHHLIIGAILALGIISLATLSFALGLGKRLGGHLYWDASAQVRVSQWSLLQELTTSQLLFGTNREQLIAILTSLRLSTGVGVIENFWLEMFVSLGIFGFTIFVIGIIELMLHFWKLASLRGKILLFATIFTASTSNSLGHKSSLLVIIVSAMAIFTEPELYRNIKQDGIERSRSL